MARQTSFGEALAHARERRGLDLSTAARKLRIRPDILRAIEEGDFARMPPRGYTSNMVAAYARLVGLNPTEVTRAYRERGLPVRRRAAVRRATVARRPRDAGTHGRAALQPRPGDPLGAAYRDDYARLPALWPFRLGRFLGPPGQGGSAARSTPTSSKGAERPGACAREASARICRSSSWAPSSWACSSSSIILCLRRPCGSIRERCARRCPSPACRTPPARDTGAANEGGTDATAPTQQPVAPTSAKFS